MEGHARTLLMLTDRPEEQEVVYKEILLKKLSVREVERIVRKIATDKVRKKKAGDFDESLISLEKRFTDTLGTRVQIQKTDFGGKLTIDYFSEEDLETILKRMREEADSSSDIGAEAAKRITLETALNIQAPEKVAQYPSAVVSSEHHSATKPDSSTESEDTLSHYVSRHSAPVDASVASIPKPTPSAPVNTTPVEESPESARDETNANGTPAPSPTMPTQTPNEETTPAEKPKESFFYHAVTDLFGRAREAQTYEATEVTSDNESDTEPIPKEESQPTPKNESDTDDGDLYSVRNFGV